MNTYSLVAPEVSREAADRIAEMLWQNDAEDQAPTSPDSDESDEGQEDGE